MCERGVDSSWGVSESVVCQVSFPLLSMTYAFHLGLFHRWDTGGRAYSFCFHSFVLCKTLCLQLDEYGCKLVRLQFTFLRVPTLTHFARCFRMSDIFPASLLQSSDPDSPAEQVRCWLRDGRSLHTRYLGEQGGLFGGSDRMIEVRWSRSVVLITETELAHIAASFNLSLKPGESLGGLQSPLSFDGGEWLNEMR